MQKVENIVTKNKNIVEKYTAAMGAGEKMNGCFTSLNTEGPSKNNNGTPCECKPKMVADAPSATEVSVPTTWTLVGGPDFPLVGPKAVYGCN